jgi:hypothetical protein
MKIGLHLFFASLLAAVLLVPTAAAKPGNGNGNANGHGHGPPAWAGGGSGGATDHGKPDSAGKGQEKKAQKAAQRDERRAARAAAEAPADEPRHDNPAWICKFEREQMGVDAFAERYGENDTNANAFGKCVSTEARDRDGVSTGGAEPPEPAEAEPAAPPEVVGEDSAGAEALAALRALFRALTGLVF